MPSRRGRPRKEPLDQRRHAILAAARDVFATHGLEAATMDEICLVAGVAKPSLYELFRSKRELYEATVSDELRHFTGHLLRAWADPAGDDPVSRTAARVGAVFAFAEQRPAGLAVLVDAWRRPSHGMRESLRNAKEGLTDRLAEVLRDEVPGAAEPPLVSEVLAVAALDSTMAVALRAFDDGAWSSEEAAAVLVGFLVAGLGSASPRRARDDRLPVGDEFHAPESTVPADSNP